MDSVATILFVGAGIAVYYFVRDENKRRRPDPPAELDDVADPASARPRNGSHYQVKEKEFDPSDKEAVYLARLSAAMQ